MPAWGNNNNQPDGVQYNQDMISGIGDHSILEIVDADVNGPALSVTNSNAGGAALALSVPNGKSEFGSPVTMFSDFTCEGIITCGDIDSESAIDLEGALKVGPINGAGEIDSGGSAVLSQNLNIGTNNVTNVVVIGQAGNDVQVAAAVLDVVGDLHVGPAGAAGDIDSGGNGVAPRDLNVGTNAGTDDVVIGHAGHDLVVNSDNIDLVGALQVGPADNPGLIDSGGSVVTPRHLKIGTSTSTDDVQIGNGNGFVDLMQITRLNDNGLVLDDAATVAAGTGFIFNDAGHGAGDSLDVYAGGALIGWFDANGWVVNP